MNMADRFTSFRLRNNNYREQLSSSPLCRFAHTIGWIDTAVDHELVFSHRKTRYNHENFPEKFHAHDHYELRFYIKGNIEYLIENSVISSAERMVIWFKPGQMHTCRLLAPSTYERYILYFSKDFFKVGDQVTPPIDFMQHETGTHMILSESKHEEVMRLLHKAEELTESEAPYAELVLKSLLVEIFYILNSQESSVQDGKAMTEDMGEVKRYIDTNYASISSVSEIASHFFFSREHLSRKFKQSFNTSVSHYLARRRIAESLPLLETMNVADVAYTVGFHSQSAFIKAFRANMLCLPSEYKNKRKTEG